MPFDRLFRQAAAEDAAADEMYDLELREAIVDLREKLELYETREWERVDQLLAARLEDAFRAMMVGEPDQMLLARERARVVSDLRAEPQLLRDRIAELQKELTQLEGEKDG